MITKQQRTRLQRAINRLVRAERWHAREAHESEERGQTLHLNAARADADDAKAKLREVLDDLENAPLSQPSRLDVLTAYCPECKSAPGEPCTGAGGKARTSVHQARWNNYRSQA